MPAKTVIQLRRDTAANWTTVNPVLAAGEAGFETDTGKLKVGDGTSSWSALSYFSSGAVEGGSLVYYQTTAPATPEVGDLWVDSDDDIIGTGTSSNDIEVMLIMGGY